MSLWSRSPPGAHLTLAGVCLCTKAPDLMYVADFFARHPRPAALEHVREQNHVTRVFSVRRLTALCPGSLGSASALYFGAILNSGTASKKRRQAKKKKKKNVALNAL